MKQTIRPVRLDLKVNWKISRNEALHKDNFVVELSMGGKTGFGEIAPNIRYGETPEKILEQFKRLPHFSSPGDVFEFCDSSDLFHSLKCGLDCAAVELGALLEGKTVEEFLGLGVAEETLPTSISVPIMDESKIESYLQNVSRFQYVKIKVNEDNAESFVKKIASLTKKPLRIDANEGFSGPKAFMKFVESSRDFNIQFMEQPFRAGDTKNYLAIRNLCPFEVMADESIEDSADFDSLSEQFDSINIKLMKTGGYHRALTLIKEARKREMKVMLGCMIESSLGISCAMRLSELADYYDLDGYLLVKNDPFGLVEEKEGRLALS